MKPMLAGKCSDITKLKYPVLVSVKLDGVRCLVIGGKLMSRTLKPIPNEAVQIVFRGLPEGTDGELILGDPTAPDAYRKTVSAVMGDGNNIMGLRYHVFDNFRIAGGFEDRLIYVRKSIKTFPGAVYVEHVGCFGPEAVNGFEETAIKEGHEGVMIRSFDGPYKQGRSTEKEGFLLKLKRFSDGEAEVIGVEELMHNENSAETNALGRTERSSCKEGLVPAGVLGTLLVRGKGGTYDGVEFGIGTGFDAADRASLWKDRKKIIGKIVKFKYFPLGSKDRPRFPVFLGWRSPLDI
jgi:DNA ligase-1